MSLTAEQRAAREGKLTASRVKVLMTGDRPGIHRLYLEMIGEQQEENLDDVWAVQLGAYTEKLNLDWYERKNSVVLTRRGEVVTHPTFTWGAATLDGWDPNLSCPIECKHTGGREPMEVIVDRYQPQMQWQMFCTGAAKCALSVIAGANEPVVDFIDMDDAYTRVMLDRAEYLMMCVDMKTPPVELDPVQAPIEANAIVDMNRSNTWGSAAHNWKAHKEDAGLFEQAKDDLKALMPAEAKKAFGFGVEVRRDRAGRRHIHLWTP